MFLFIFLYFLSFSNNNKSATKITTLVMRCKSPKNLLRTKLPPAKQNIKTQTESTTVYVCVCVCAIVYK